MKKQSLFLTLALVGILGLLTPRDAEGVVVGNVVTQGFFDSIKTTSAGCAGKNFYTRAAFLKAAAAYPQFGQTKREIAAFFAQVTHESGHFCYVEEIDKWHRYCQPSKTYPCAPGKKYYGRGPIQITWNYNYGAAGKALKLNLVKFPETVAKDPVVAFKTTLWFWMKNVHPVVNQGFGATTRRINGGECNGGRPAAVRARVQYYLQYCKKFGITPGPNLYC